jgi:hypothetical protein
MIARWLFLFGFAVALLISLGCGGSSSDNGSTGPALACTDGGAAAADAVTMTCGGATDSTTEQVNVVMGVPAAGATSLRGLNFDVTYDSTKLTFVSATNYTGGPFPAAALVVATALPNDPTPHVIVSIQQVGTDPDVVIGPGQHVMLHLSFTRTPAATFAPTPLEFDLATSEVTPPTPPTVPAVVTFGSALALSYQ